MIFTRDTGGSSLIISLFFVLILHWNSFFSLILYKLFKVRIDLKGHLTSRIQIYLLLGSGSCDFLRRLPLCLEDSQWNLSITSCPSTDFYFSSVPWVKGSFCFLHPILYVLVHSTSDQGPFLRSSEFRTKTINYRYTGTCIKFCNDIPNSIVYIYPIPYIYCYIHYVVNIVF